MARMTANRERRAEGGKVAAAADARHEWSHKEFYAGICPDFLQKESNDTIWQVNQPAPGGTLRDNRFRGGEFGAVQGVPERNAICLVGASRIHAFRYDL